jgi:hypothetical protein
MSKFPVVSLDLSIRAYDKSSGRHALVKKACNLRSDHVHALSGPRREVPY